MTLSPRTLLLPFSLCLLLLAGCAGLLGPREVELPLAKLQQSLDRNFPMSQRVLEIFEVNLSRPQLLLDPATNRISTSFDATISQPLFGARPRQGRLTLSGVLQFDAGRMALMLTDPRVEQFSVDGLDSHSAQKLAQLGGLLLEKILRDKPLYSFSPGQLSYAGMRFTPTTIVTKSDALVVTLVPAK